MNSYEDRGVERSVSHTVDLAPPIVASPYRVAVLTCGHFFRCTSKIPSKIYCSKCGVTKRRVKGGSLDIFAQATGNTAREHPGSGDQKEFGKSPTAAARKWNHGRNSIGDSNENEFGVHALACLKQGQPKG